jgi:hypothetical protein
MGRLRKGFRCRVQLGGVVGHGDSWRVCCTGSHHRQVLLRTAYSTRRGPAIVDALRFSAIGQIPEARASTRMAPSVGTAELRRQTTPRLQ